MHEFEDVRSLAPADDVSTKAVAAARHALSTEIATGGQAAHGTQSRIRRRNRLRPRARRGIAVGVAVLAVVAVTGGVIAGLRLTNSTATNPMESSEPVAAEPVLLQCGYGSETFAETKITEPQFADELDDPGRATLESAADDLGVLVLPLLGDLSDWIVVEQKSNELTLLRPREPVSTDASWQVPANYDVVNVDPYSAGVLSTGIWTCALTYDLGDLSVADVTIDPAYGLDPGSSELHLLVLEQACNSGQDATGRVELRTKKETADEVSLLIGIRPRNEGAQACPGHPATPFVVQLDAALGDRSVMDLVYVPAREVEVLNRMQLLPPE